MAVYLLVLLRSRGLLPRLFLLSFVFIRARARYMDVPRWLRSFGRVDVALTAPAMLSLRDERSM